MPGVGDYRGGNGNFGGGGQGRGAPDRNRGSGGGELEVRAPYNFVPLSKHVVFPEWGELVSQDMPFSDGFSGSIRVTVTAETPIVVGGGSSRRGKQEVGRTGEWNAVDFFLDPSGRPAIPGSSLKGIIRNVVEIAAFGKMQGVDDQNLGLRDLTSGGRRIYGQRLTADDGDRRLPTYWSKTHAGFLRFSRTRGWEIVPCRYGRISHEKLASLAKEAQIAGLPGSEFAPATYMKNIALAVAKTWRVFVDGTTHATLHDFFQKDQRNRLKYIDFDEAVGLVKTKRLSVPATLVVTGPVESKTKEFLFYGDEDGFQSAPVSVPGPVIKAFEAVHRSQLDSEDMTPWKFWKRVMTRRGASGDPIIGPGSLLAETFPGVPVFYLASDGAGTAVQALGLAQMFKLPYDVSIGGMIDNTSKDHRGSSTTGEHPWDLAELLFGTVSKAAGRSLRGRISFGLARSTGTAATATRQPPIVLASPKPTYYPNYVRQPYAKTPPAGRLADGASVATSYQSYTLAGRTGNPPPLPEIAGWKRYVPRPQVDPSPRAGNDQKRVATTLGPLPAGTTFETTVNFHNLRTAELGALIWACTLSNSGPSTELGIGCHLVGSGKPFGYGRTTWKITDAQLRPNALRNGQDLVIDGDLALKELGDAVRTFEAYMARAIRPLASCSESSDPWAESVQIRALRMLADVRTTATLRGGSPYPTLTTKPRKNEFVEIKKSKKALPQLVRDEAEPPRGAANPPQSKSPDWLR